MTHKIEGGKIKIHFFDGDSIEFHWGHLGEVIEDIKEVIKGHEHEYGLAFVQNKADKLEEA